MNKVEYKKLFDEIIGRDETALLSNKELQEYFSETRILIIGAGGSIGSALARRLSEAKIENVFFLDRDESSLHGLALELSDTAASHSEKCFIADVRDAVSLNEAIFEIKPALIIHAAALKHLPILERFPREGFLTNLLGTLNVAEACIENSVKQFVNISTDKAANPTSILGKTKKLAELVTEEILYPTNVINCSVRFGNVFASRGSVIETFIHQLRNDLPITLTDEKVTRYFMSNSEAANLVLAAASLKENGIFIQNMGQEVLIMDVINRLAKYFNRKPKIQIVGLKKGEKMNEELNDGPVLSTKFNSISRSTKVIKEGLAQEIKEFLPTTSKTTLIKINELSNKYIERFNNDF